MARSEPDLQWLEDMPSTVNADPAFRKLGSADFTLGLHIGDQARLVTFQAFEVAEVAATDASHLRDADLVIEMTPKAWNRYLRQRARGTGATLLSLDLERHVVKASTPLKRLLLERYNRSIQALLDHGAARRESSRRSPA